ncbi:MAG: hypothetical protein QX197_04270 [Methylococcaceae bacterium]
MTADSKTTEYSLLETGSLISFRIIDEATLTGPDEAEFAVRVELIMTGEDDADASEIAEWAAFGFMFLLGTLSFDGARPRGLSLSEYQENDEFRVNDFFDYSSQALLGMTEKMEIMTNRVSALCDRQ